MYSAHCNRRWDLEPYWGRRLIDRDNSVNAFLKLLTISYIYIYNFVDLFGFWELMRLRETQKALHLPFFLFSSFSFTLKRFWQHWQVFCLCPVSCYCKHVWPVPDVFRGHTDKQRFRFWNFICENMACHAL